MELYISENDCIGCGLCADICAETFMMGDDRVAHVAQMPDRDHEECAKEAMLDCPTDAIVMH